MIYVVARDASRNIGIRATDILATAITKFTQFRIDLPKAATVAYCSLELIGIRLSNPDVQAVVREDLQLLKIIHGLATHHRVHAARVITDHPTKRAVRMSRRIRREHELMLIRGVVQLVANDSGFDPGRAVVWVYEEQREAADSLGASSYDFAFRISQPAETKRTQWGQARIIDSSTFKVSNTVASALVTVDVSYERLDQLEVKPFRSEVLRSYIAASM